jgi:hypothetical protein
VAQHWVVSDFQFRASDFGLRDKAAESLPVPPLWCSALFGAAVRSDPVPATDRLSGGGKHQCRCHRPASDFFLITDRKQVHADPKDDGGRREQ